MVNYVGIICAISNHLKRLNILFNIFFYFHNFNDNILYNSVKGGIALNAPTVYDVLAARISKCVAFAGRTKCAGATAWEWIAAE
jgi:hypothetical protein